MSQPKYYTPTVDDLVWGLEYEEMDADGTWNPQILLEHNRDILLELKSWPTIYRIKHLDEDDIVELGWVYYADRAYIIPKYELNHHLDGSIAIYFSSKCIYDGQCHNKAELKRLMNNFKIDKP